MKYNKDSRRSENVEDIRHNAFKKRKNMGAGGHKQKSWPKGSTKNSPLKGPKIPAPSSAKKARHKSGTLYARSVYKPAKKHSLIKPKWKRQWHNKLYKPKD